MPDSPAPTMRTSKCSDAMIVLRAAASTVITAGLSGHPRFYTNSRDEMPGTSPGHHEIIGTSFRGAQCANPESKDSPMCNCTSEAWSFGPSRNDVLFSIPVVIRLERAFRLDADILGLVGAQFG